MTVGEAALLTKISHSMKFLRLLPQTVAHSQASTPDSRGKPPLAGPPRLPDWSIEEQQLALHLPKDTTEGRCLSNSLAPLRVLAC